MKYGYLSEEGFDIWYCVNRECLDVLTVEHDYEQNPARPPQGEFWLVTTRGVLVKLHGRNLKYSLGRLGALMQELKALRNPQIMALFEKYDIKVC